MAKSKIQSDETSIAILATDVAYIKESVKKIDDTLSLMEKDFVRRSEFDTYKDQQTQFAQDTKLSISSHASAISANEIAMVTLKTQIRTWAILGGVILAVVQSIVTAFIISLITN